ncbi:hypothetical protein CEXT_314741 [Caerostris extrusa]|uniref:Uncharacterized protein n=1 Tax=Caerostris extrusa TaxID=172846 RepID=A0AAV4NR50_CAEEX|nr:hypothetical protein CEXT_314741 [Caerostris extrusa]
MLLKLKSFHRSTVGEKTEGPDVQQQQKKIQFTLRNYKKDSNLSKKVYAWPSEAWTNFLPPGFQADKSFPLVVPPPFSHAAGKATLCAVDD